MDNSNLNPLAEDQQADSLANCRDILAFVQASFEQHNEEVVLNNQARQGLVIILGWILQTLKLTTTTKNQ